MSGARVDIDRLRVAVHGVPTPVVEAAIGGLAEEVRRRIGAVASSEWRGFGAAETAITPVHSKAVLDAATLRQILADRLVQAMVSPSGSAPSGREGTE